MDTTHRLRVKTSGGSVSDYLIRSERVSVGRADSCDVALESRYASRLHAVVEIRGSEAFITDQRSRNGTLVNGQPVPSKAHRLMPGDEIRIGDCVLTYVRHAGAGDSTQLFLGSQGSVAQKDAIFVDVSAWEVWVGSEPLPTRLSLQEFTLLRLLFEQGGNVCTRQYLGDAIWGQGQYDLNMLHRLVHRLREKVEPEPKSPRFIEAIPGVGYRLRQSASKGEHSQGVEHGPDVSAS